MIKMIKEFFENLFNEKPEFNTETKDISHVRALQDSKGHFMDRIPMDIR